LFVCYLGQQDPLQLICYSLKNSLNECILEVIQKKLPQTHEYLMESQNYTPVQDEDLAKINNLCGTLAGDIYFRKVPNSKLFIGGKSLPQVMFVDYQFLQIEGIMVYHIISISQGIDYVENIASHCIFVRPKIFDFIWEATDEQLRQYCMKKNEVKLFDILYHMRSMYDSIVSRAKEYIKPVIDSLQMEGVRMTLHISSHFPVRIWLDRKLPQSTFHKLVSNISWSLES